VNASYRLGILIVSATVLLSSALVMAGLAMSRPASTPRAGQDLGNQGFELGSFRLTERSGRTVTEGDLSGDVWVSAFIFTRCPISCPKISSVMKGLQQPLSDAGVKLVSLSVDPDYDTPEVLTRYANGLGADPARWWFLTGKQDEIVDLILNRFHLPVGRDEGAPADPEAKAESVRHSPRLVLVDRGNVVVGFFDSDDPEALKTLVAKATRKASWARKLPAVNATLNGTCALLLMLGWVLILTRRVRGHAACMIAAVVVSAVFLGCYLVYHFQVGSVSFQGTGRSKVIYLSILLSHTVLATLGVVPLVALTLFRAIRKDFHRHASIARVTFPIWLYVSITGVVIYWMLYQMPVTSSSF
jgi:protein SCO1/2/putative membrane protein